MSEDPRPVAVSVVLPVHNGTETLGPSLRALRRSLERCAARGWTAEVLVVDDRSTDGSARFAASFGADRVLPLPAGQTGAAAARNHGAAHARGEVLLFVDADVEVAPDALPRLLAPLFAARGETTRADAPNPVDASIGVYAPCPAELGLWSRVKDLSIRMNHGRGGHEIPWFWTALGAVRRAAFERVGGFDVHRFGSGATIEDMDLGFRLSAAGFRIVQVADARARHSHRFDWPGLARNDFRKSRAWMGVLLRTGAAAAQSHGSTRGGEGLALGCATLALGGAGVAVVAPAVGVPTSLAGFAGLAWVLREDLRRAVDERGAGEALAYLGVRASLYPVAAAGALRGVVDHLAEGLGGRL